MNFEKKSLYGGIIGVGSYADIAEPGVGSGVRSLEVTGMKVQKRKPYRGLQ